LLNKNFLIIVLFIFFLSISLNSEIIEVSKLTKELKPFSYSRDLFAPKQTKKEVIKNVIKNKQEEIKVKQEKIKARDEELFDNIIYEGFVLRINNKTVLLNINGDYITGKIGDTILDEIGIVDISSKKIQIEIKGKKYNINLKADENEDK